MSMEVTPRQGFIKISGDAGEMYVRAEAVRERAVVNKHTVRDWNKSGEFPNAINEVYIGTEVEEVRLCRGFGVRPDDIPETSEDEWKFFTEQAVAESYIANLADY